MRQKKFSVVALVMGILNLINSLLGLACTACQGIVFGFFFAIVMSVANQEPQAAQAVDEITALMDEHLPGFLVFLIAFISSGLCMGIVLFVAGIGLIAQQNWARWLSMFYSIVTLFAFAGAFVYFLVILDPGMRGITAEFQQKVERMRKERPPDPGIPIRARPNHPFQNTPVLGNFGSFAYIGWQMLYAFVLLIMMLLPGVGRELSGRAARERYYEGYDDYQYGGSSRYDRH